MVLNFGRWEERSVFGFPVKETMDWMLDHAGDYWWLRVITGWLRVIPVFSNYGETSASHLLTYILAHTLYFENWAFKVLENFSTSEWPF